MGFGEGRSPSIRELPEMDRRCGDNELQRVTDCERRDKESGVDWNYRWRIAQTGSTPYRSLLYGA